ncbi:TonB-dependent siderophore receptor [Agrobacterium rhizogenes]|nr:TonB-dependent siderophore receptor [Rhizobium rhizogenes]NTI97931.1 TonB-dependent siderophore receptor [Rhizobium rhizogenes]NTJ60321.1 TonB-dependent siderophore receptor [Rhizobium rhizogenes]OCJ19253.1 ferrichrome-iron receptor [Agrobacterium sp. B133/95]
MGRTSSHGQQIRKHGNERILARALLASTLLSCLSVTSVLPAMGQQARPAATQAMNFQIPAQPLDAAISAFIRATGWQISYSSAIARGKTSGAAIGSMTPTQALQRLVAGTGIVVRVGAPGSAALVDPTTTAASGMAADGSTVLAPITVTSQDGAFGPTNGYIAQNALTGTKTGTPLIETPQSVSVVTRKQMEDQNSKTVSEALRYTPGVAAETRTGRYDYPNIRGFGTPGGSEANWVGLMDGLRMPRGIYYIAPSIDPYMLERVEVLKGPSSILYGAVNPGGVVNLWSKRPTEEPLHEVDLQYGTFNRKQIGFDFSGPVNNDNTVLYRLTGVARDADSQVDFAKDQRLSISPAVTWQPDGDTKLTILGNAQRDPNAGNFNYLPYVGTVKSASWGKLSRNFTEADPNFDQSQRSQYSIGYEFEHRFNDIWTVRQNLRFMHADYDYKSVFQNGWLTPTQLSRMSIHSVESFDGLAIDNQAQAEFLTGEIQHTALFGLDYRRNNADVKMGYGAVDPLDVLNPVYYQTIASPSLDYVTSQKLNQTGVYVQDQMKLGNLSLLTGIRGDWVDAETRNNYAPAYVPQSDKAFSWRTALMYNFDNGIAPYASYSTSFEPVLGTDWSGNPFKPTKGEQYEVGAKYQPDGWESFLTASLFDITQRNVKTADPDTSHPYASVQTGEVRSRGVELEAHVNVNDNLSLIASYSHIDIKNTEDTTYQGKRPYGVPSNLASLWANYEFDDGTLDGLSLGAGVRYVGSSYGDAANSLKVPSYTLVDAALRYDFGKLNPDMKNLQLSVNATNLFNKTFVSSCWSETSCFYGNGRTITANLKYRW